MKQDYLFQMEPGFDATDIQAVSDCVRSTWLMEGPSTAAFERAVAEYVGARYAAAVPSCTVALAVSLMALDLGPGDEVIIPTLTFAATANAVSLVGARPILADIRSDTFGLDPLAVERAITPRTRAVLPVWFNGRDPDIQALIELARQHQLFVVEDAACALGSRVGGLHAGTFGQLGCISFNTTKIITTGMGGVIVTDDDELYEKVKRLKNHGRLDRRDAHPVIGFNFGFSDLLAALGLAQMKKLPQRVEWKRTLCRWYWERLEVILGVEIIRSEPETCLWYPDVFVTEPADLKTYLEAQGLGTRLFFPPLHTQPAYQISGEFPNAQKAAGRGLWLPAAPDLDEAQVERVCAAIKAWAQQ
jgi:perosamine synthetase